MRCPACNTANPPEAVRCEECGEKLPSGPRPAAPQRLEEVDEEEEPVRRPRRRVPGRDEDDYADDGGISTIIPYRNPKALASYYLGIFSVIPGLAVVLGPLALIFGILGLRYRSAHPEAKGTVHAVVGIVMGTLCFLCNIGVGIGFLIFYPRRNF